MSASLIGHKRRFRNELPNAPELKHFRTSEPSFPVQVTPVMKPNMQQLLEIMRQSLEEQKRQTKMLEALIRISVGQNPYIH